MKLNRIASAIDRIGRNDINENFDILERGYGKAYQDAQIAREQSDYAVETSYLAEQKADSVQNQFNQIVIEGDSSVEAAQARVSADGTVYNTLKARLDGENDQVNQQLEQIAIDFNSVVGDGVADDTLALQSIIDSAYASDIKTLKFPIAGATYKVTGTLIIKSDMHIDFNNATIIANPEVAGYARLESGNAVISAIKEGELNNITLKNVQIIVNRHTWHGIYLYAPDGMADITICNVKVLNPSWDGILCHGKGENSANHEAWRPGIGSNLRYRVIDCVCINDHPELKTRTGIMIEHCYGAIIENCYVRGFHSGYHCEGSSDITFTNCIGEDNSNDNQEDADYAGDFMIGRAENVTMISCKSRTISELPPSYPPLTKRRGLMIPNQFQSGLIVASCSFVSADIYSNEATNNSDTTKSGIIFENCMFLDSTISLTRQSEGEFYEGVILKGNFFKNSSLYADFAYGLVISGNTFVNFDRLSVLITLSKNITITGNVFKGGSASDSILWRNSQLAFSVSESVAVNGNSFLIDDTYSGSVCIGLNDSREINIVGNTLVKKDGFAISEVYQTAYPSKYCNVTNNIIKHTVASSETGVLLADETCIKKDNIIITV